MVEVWEPAPALRSPRPPRSPPPHPEEVAKALLAAEHELQGLRRYSRVAKYSALGLTGIAGEGLKKNSPIARALEGAYIKVVKETGPDYQAAT